MANATAITVTALTADAVATQPTADVLDTGTSAVTLAADIGGAAGRVILEVTNAAAESLTVAVLAGDNPPAQRAGLGNLSAALAQNATKVFGPFEGMRFLQDDGKLNVTFTPGGTIDATVRCYKLPKA